MCRINTNRVQHHLSNGGSIHLQNTTNRVDVRTKNVRDVTSGDRYHVTAFYFQGGSWTLSFHSYESVEKLVKHWKSKADILRIHVEDKVEGLLTKL